MTEATVKTTARMMALKASTRVRIMKTKNAILKLTVKLLSTERREASKQLRNSKLTMTPKMSFQMKTTTDIGLEAILPS
jgi:hypothetical protein